MIFIAPNRFIWVFCQLEALRHCFPPSVRHILEELPETLDETYDRILRDINKANRDHAHRLLQCLIAAVRPLRVAELADVLAVDFGTGACGGVSKLNPDWRWDDQQQAVLSTCSSLISIVDENEFQVVQFSHFSVKEYLTSSRLADSNANVSRYHILLEPAHTILAKACLGVLLRLGRRSWRNPESYSPLTQYAARHWVDHAKFEQVSSHVREAMEDLFDLDKPFFDAWRQVHDMDDSKHTLPLYELSDLFQPRPTADSLYYAALSGIYDLTEHLIMKYPQQVNATGGNYVSPLGAALAREHFDVAQLLYEHGADVAVRGYGNRTLLYAASRSGNRQIVEWVLSHGADLNLHSGLDCSTPLIQAALHGQVEVCHILLQHNADKNALDKRGQTPLHRASEGGYIEVARLFLDRRVDVNSLDNNLSTALHLASKRGHVDVAQVLLEHGVDVNAQDTNRSTALHLVSYYSYISGCTDIAQFLLKHGVDVNVQDDKGSTALHLALDQGHTDIAQSIIEHGLNVNVRDNNRFTALHLASRRGHTDIARLLLEHGADVNVQGDDRSTALHLALEQGHTDIAQFLIEHGVDVNVRDNNRFTALHLASSRGHTDIARLLLEHGVDVNAWGKNRFTALHLASRMGKLEVVRLLLEHGADVEAQDYMYRTPYVGETTR
jgi:ankyrin repeat protein